MAAALKGARREERRSTLDGEGKEIRGELAPIGGAGAVPIAEKMANTLMCASADIGKRPSLLEVMREQAAAAAALPETQKGKGNYLKAALRRRQEGKECWPSAPSTSGHLALPVVGYASAATAGEKSRKASHSTASEEEECKDCWNGGHFRPRFLSHEISAATQPSSPVPPPPPMPPALHRASSSWEAGTAMFSLGGTLLRSLSALSDEAETDLTVHTHEGRPSRAAKTTSLVVKLSRLYSIGSAVTDDIAFAAALARGPPYETPVFIRNTFNPVLKPEAMDKLKEGLRPDSRFVLDVPNAGGQSENSEAISLEVLAAYQNMRLWASEMQIRYQVHSSLIDYIASMEIACPGTVDVPDAPIPKVPDPPVAPVSGRDRGRKVLEAPISFYSAADRRKPISTGYPDESLRVVTLKPAPAPATLPRVTMGDGSLLPQLKATDVLVGVSVTRAMKYDGGPEAYTYVDAETILLKKLRGLLSAAQGVDPCQRWSRQILHIWAEAPRIVTILQKTLQDPLRISPALWRNTIVLCTVAPPSTMHNIIFKNDQGFAVPIAYDHSRHESEVARLRAETMLSFAKLDGHTRRAGSRV